MALYGMTQEEMKGQYRAKQQEIRDLEAESAEAIGRGEAVPRPVRHRLIMARIEAEEFRMWGNRDLTREIREWGKGKPQHLSTSDCT